MSETVIGVDLGTSSCKAIAFDLAGARVATARRPYPVDRGSGAATQRPEHWVEAALDALAELVSGLGDRSVRAIGLSGQIGTHVLLDDAGRALHPAVTWQDGRSAVAADEVWSVLDRDAVARDLGTWLPSGAAWPLLRMTWLRAEFPSEFARAHRLAQPKDVLCLALTGHLASDASSWRGVVDPGGRVLSTALDALGLPDLVPDIDLGTAAAGALLPAIAARTGLPAGIPVHIGWNDLNASLVGVGATGASDGFDVGGTSEHLGVVAAEPVRDFTVVALPQHGVDPSRYTVYGVTSNGGSAREWIAGITGADAADFERAAGRPGDGGLLFLPYLLGERAPVWDADAAGAFVGLRASHERDDLLRAVLEGVALNLRVILDSLPSVPDAIRSTGGTASSPGWNRIKADVLGRPLVTTRESDSSALGAAIAGAVGTGAYPDVPTATAAMVHEADVVEPDPAATSRVADIAADFTALYPALREVSHRLRKRGSR